MTQLFTDVSANMEDLKEVLVNKKEQLVWTPEEDDILEKCRNNKSSAEYRLLIRLKGEKRLLRRIKFNFE